ncbi:MAG: LuxR C-terminal-related transcriptional regulator, partial [Thermomicrobiales bacterium]
FVARLGVPWTLADVLAMILDRLLILYFTEQAAERRQLEREILTQYARIQSGAPGMPNSQQCLLSQRILSGRWDEAYRTSSETLADPSARLLVPLAAVRLAHGILARCRGDLESSWAQARALLPAGPDTMLGDVPYQFSVDAQLLAGRLALDAGVLELARSWIEAHSRWLGESGVVLGQAECHLLWARYHLLAGDVTLADERARQALDRAREPRQPLALIAAQRFLGELATLAGRFADAAAHLAASEKLAAACEAPFEQALTGIALAELALARGDLEPARTQLASARLLAEPLGALPTLARIDALESRCDAASIEPLRQAVPAGISPRELDVLRLVASGLSTADIAERLFLSPRTVTTHLSSLYGKLGVNTRAAVVPFAIDSGHA